jgi:hypothetical protein
VGVAAETGAAIQPAAITATAAQATAAYRMLIMNFSYRAFVSHIR